MGSHNVNKKVNIDFLGIGVVRSATTWLTECLKEHPEIYIPTIKEVNFFDTEKKGGDYLKGLKWYYSFFRKAKADMIKGEFTTHYMFSPESHKLIKRHYPEVKLIACLRNPVDMTYSYYWWRKSNFRSSDFPSTFEGALEKNNEYIERGMYYEQLKRYFDHFPKENIKIILFEDIVKKPREVLREIYAYLEADDKFVPSAFDKKVNKTKGLRFKLLADAANGCIKTLGLLKFNSLAKYLTRSPFITGLYTEINKKDDFEYLPMQAATRMKLKKAFREDIERLEKLIGCDLGAWYS